MNSAETSITGASLCPSDAAFGELMSGRGDDPVARAHLAVCPACRERYDRLGDDERLLGELRRAASASAPGTARDAELGSAATPPSASGAGDNFPGYEITELLDRGGQGIVYKAVQISTRRIVALKLLMTGVFATSRQRQRFKREVEVVSGLQHRNIVTIFDSDVSAAGRDFYAMQFIDGRPLDEFIANSQTQISTRRREPAAGGRSPRSDGRLVSTADDQRETILLFLKIADAVQYAHEHGVIHRDLKPANILIDAGGEPNILDFGLARPAVADGPDGCRVTLTGDFLGTLAYASPEQTSGDPNLVDVRTDIYSLGVILYEMLTRRRPYSVEGSLQDALDRVRHTVPAPPSSHDARLDTDLDTIVLKALAKERERRYASVDALVRDLRHYLAGEPIDARRDSALYVIRKQMQRYRWALRAGAAFVVVALASVIALSILYRQANLERNRAQAAESRIQAQLHETAAARDAEKAARETAQSETAKAVAVREFLAAMLLAADPGTTGQRDVTVLQALDAAQAKLDAGELKDQPEVEAAVRTTLGATYRVLGKYQQAATQLRAARAIRLRLGLSAPADDAVNLHHLALTLREQGKLPESEALFREALASAQAAHGDAHEDVAISMQGLSSVLFLTGRLDEAESLCTAALAMNRKLFGDAHVEIATGLHNLAMNRRARGRFDDAESLFREALAMRRKLLTASHPDIASTLSQLGNVLRELGRLDEAGAALAEAIAMRSELLGDAHPSVAGDLNELAKLHKARGESVEAESKFRRSLSIYRAAFGDNHPAVATLEHNLALALVDLGRPEEAEVLIRDAIQTNRRALGKDHPVVAQNSLALAAALFKHGAFGDTEASLLEAEAILRSDPRAPLRVRRECVSRLVELYAAWGNPDSEQCWRDVLAALP